MKAHIVFKFGTQITVDVTEIETERDRAGDLVRMRWNTPENYAAKLHTVDMREVAAIYVTRK